MDYTEFIITVPRAAAQQASDLATLLCPGGLYIEDYADLEEQAQAIAHVDLIEQELLDKPRGEVRLHLYASREENPVAFSEELQSRLLALGLPHTLESRGVKQEDWENSWKQYYHPIEIGTRLAVAPSWEDYRGGRRTVLRLDPGMAFGTGTHETTALCLAVLDARVKGGEAVLDVGTGSGILAVAALLLGAKSALGVDIDPVAVRTARENAQRNGVAERFTAFAGDLACVGAGGMCPGAGEPAPAARGKYDIITANIVADAILRLAPSAPPLLAPGGVFVASGIIDERAAEVEAGLAKTGLALVEKHEQRGWVALVYSH